MKLLNLAILLLAALVFGGCASSDGSERERGLSIEEAPELTFTEVARIAEPMFGVVRSVHSTPRGELIVGDWTTRSFSVFNEDDQFLYSFGSEGEGPGEFRYLPTLIVDRDTFYTFEQWPDRLTAWIPGEKEPVRIGTLDEGLAGRTVIDYRDGRYVLRKSETFRPGHDTASERFLVISTWDAEAGLRDSLYTSPDDEYTVVATSSTVSVRSTPFSRRNVFAADGQGRIIHAWTEHPEVHVYSPSMQLERTVRLDYTPLEFTRSDLDEYVAENPGMDGDMRRAVSDMAPDHWPAITQLIVDDDDRIWVGLRAPAGEPAQWVVVSPEGEIIGRTMLPANLQLSVVRGNRAYGVYQEDPEAGGPVLVRFEVSEADTRV